MKILVTGSTGFIGKHLVLKLASQGHDLTAIIRSRTDKKLLVPDCMSYYEDDGSTEKLISFCSEHKFDGCIHLASVFKSKHIPDDINELINSNILFPNRILEAAERTKIKWFINTGTFWQHFNNKSYSPVNLYAATKQAFEDIAQYYIETSKLIFVTLKLNDTFGPGDTRPKIFNLWMDIVKKNTSIDMSPGEQIIDINYIDNVVDAYLKLIDLMMSDNNCNYNGKSFVVSSRERYNLKEIASLFEEVVETKLNINWGARPYKEREVMVPYSKGETVPGWEQKIDIKKGIGLFYEGQNK